MLSVSAERVTLAFDKDHLDENKTELPGDEQTLRRTRTDGFGVATGSETQSELVTGDDRELFAPDQTERRP